MSAASNNRFHGRARDQVELVARRVVEIEIRDVYGKSLAYPLNREAGLIAELSGHRTLTRGALSLAEGLGFEIEVVNRRSVEELG